MDPSRVQSFWYGESLSPHEDMCIRSFLANGHGFDLYTYNHDLDVPAGCRVRDAAEIFPENQIFFYDSDMATRGVVLFSDAFRYKLLAEKGGWWVDLDVICLTEDLPQAPYVFGYEMKRKLVGTAVLKTPSGDLLMRQCLKAALALGAGARWGEAGPDLLTEQVGALGLGKYALPVSTFYPYSWTSATDAFDPRETRRLLKACRKSACVHLWSEILRRNDIDKRLPPPEASLIHHFFEMYARDVPQDQDAVERA